MVLLALVGLSVARPAIAAWPHVPLQNLPVCTASKDQTYPRSVSDGNGGVIVAWVDTRNFFGGSDIYAQHVVGTGAVDAFWPAQGLPVCTALGNQYGTDFYSVSIVSDGKGGAIIFWLDDRSQPNAAILYAQHVLVSGSVDPNWPVDGRAISTDESGEVVACSDGAGGAVVAWLQEKNGYADKGYATHLLASGALDPNWPSPGCVVIPYALFILRGMASDGKGGGIAVWQDSTFEAITQHVLASGVVDPAWPSQGLQVPANGVTTVVPRLVSDSAGGAIVAWLQGTQGPYPIYAQRIKAWGVVDASWPAGGRVIGTGTWSDGDRTLVADGSDGAILTWSDGGSLIFAHHVLASGQLDPAWPQGGTQLSALSPSNRIDSDSDGAGGAIVTWDHTNASDDVYIQRVVSSGAIQGLWPANGRVVSSAPINQRFPVVANEGGGHAVVVWQDNRSGNDWDIYAQRVDASSYLGNPAPLLHVPISDFPMDQGGIVQLTFDPSYLDTEDPFLVDHYQVMRWSPSLSGGGFYWQPIQNVDAVHTAPIYSVEVATLGDSTPAGIPWTRYMVVAYDASGALVLPSDPDSGYSVDNIPPETPPLLTGTYEAGMTHLHWLPNTDADLAGYRLYRGEAPSFAPGPENLVAALPDTGFTDAGQAGGFYKLSAVDIHGNESGYAVLAPSQTAGAGPDRPVVLGLAAPAPNPARGSTRIAFGLPTESAASLAVYDVTGRRVRVLADGVLSRGEQARAWDLRDDAGHVVGSGLYFVRLEAGGRGFTQRLVVAGR